MATQIPREVFILLCGAGVLQGLYLCFHIIGHSVKKLNAAPGLLCTLLLLLTLRVGKSMGWILYPDMPVIFLNLGFAAHFAVGPMLYLYLRQFLRDPKLVPWDFGHFGPTLLIILFSPILSLDDFWYRGGYGFLLCHQILYHLIITGLIWNKSNCERICKKDRVWIYTLFFSIGVFQMAYISNYLLRLISYAWAPLVFIIIIYAISYVALMRNGFFSKIRQIKKYKNIKIGEAELRHYHFNLTQLMTEHKHWLDPAFSLSKLSEISGIPNHIVSRIINELEKVNFATYVSNYRIEEAKRLLDDPINYHLTIAAIANDCGFHSLSSFNRAFKRRVNLTPSQYRRRLDIHN